MTPTEFFSVKFTSAVSGTTLDLFRGVHYVEDKVSTRSGGLQTRHVTSDEASAVSPDVVGVP